MTDLDKTKQKLETTVAPGGNGEQLQLDDTRRVKVLSPGMMVFKRFIRNDLAVIGFAILFFMFVFSFLGPVLSPYEQTQVFKGIGTMTKDFAGATYNTELRYTVAEGAKFDSAARAQFLLALGRGDETFTVNNSVFYYVAEGENTYRILQLNSVGTVLVGVFKATPGATAPDGLVDAYEAAVAKKETSFTLGDVVYRITKSGKAAQISTEQDVALATLNVYDPYNQTNAEMVASYDFRLASTRALTEGKDSFEVDGQTYTMRMDEGQVAVLDSTGAEYAEISSIIVNPLDQAVFLSVEFKSAVREAIDNSIQRFSFVEENGEQVEYIINRVNTTYNIKRETPTELIRAYESPSGEHLLGLDSNGMDVATRLMYGGQVSLLVGFVVIFIEVFIGIIVGGISGYFGGAIDTALMRFVDLFNSIPFYPMVLIFGSVMDTLEVKPMARIFLLMIVLGILGWTGVARVVRGQILSLREQDFMVATEATGIRTSRRIFKHLVPNVMPILIVQATAGLGGIIIAEATLGFLGLGVKYPLASWGSIINAASEAHVMTNYWFMWIPAGMLILLTVLGFNFVGDGLRDAYDPKMKR